MKNIRNLNTNDSVDARLELSNLQVPVPMSKFSFGSVADKYPVILDGGKTIIFISNKKKEAATRKKYEQLRSKMFDKFVKKQKV
jgi:hypothetical protein